MLVHRVRHRREAYDETVTISRAEYDVLTERLEDLDDIVAALKAGGGQPMPLEWARRIIEGESPVRVWREFRGLSLRALAAKAGVEPGRPRPRSNWERSPDWWRPTRPSPRRWMRPLTGWLSEGESNARPEPEQRSARPPWR